MPDASAYITDIDSLIVGCSQSRTDEARAELRANTQQAIATGAVGLPWIVATNVEGRVEGFWGFDRLHQISRYLRLDRRQACRL
jgi:2-hydroxychromene-2-carboxylate isomerase